MDDGWAKQKAHNQALNIRHIARTSMEQAQRRAEEWAEVLQEAEKAVEITRRRLHEMGQ